MVIPMKEVDGKVAFITGGSSGIGLGIARAFVDAGLKVAIGYQTKEHVDEAMRFLDCARDRVHAIRVDVTDRAALEKAAGETASVFGKVHVLVSNAGVVIPTTLSTTTYDDWDFVMGVNVDGVFNSVRTFLPRIRAHGEGGQIIATSSILGLFVGGSGQGAYSVSKFAVVGMMEALRADLVGVNIGVSVFCPGLVTSNVMDSIRNRPSNLPETGFNAGPEKIAREKQARSNPQLAMDPLEAGRCVLRAMRNNDMYILTHPEFGQIVRVRNEALLASIPVDMCPSDARAAMARSMLEESIYISERDRKLCARVIPSETTT